VTAAAAPKRQACTADAVDATNAASNDAATTGGDWGRATMANDWPASPNTNNSVDAMPMSMLPRRPASAPRHTSAISGPTAQPIKARPSARTSSCRARLSAPPTPTQATTTMNKATPMASKRGKRPRATAQSARAQLTINTDREASTRPS
jgi:hypothetical protein